jgi:hypothetical protein
MGAEEIDGKGKEWLRIQEWWGKRGMPLSSARQGHEDLFHRFVGGWVWEGGWVGGWMDVWMDGWKKG